jgi:hypothetical protein
LLFIAGRLQRICQQNSKYQPRLVMNAASHLRLYQFYGLIYLRFHENDGLAVGYFTDIAVKDRGRARGSELGM